MRHGIDAIWLESLPVTETFKSEVAWGGEVQVFAVEHPRRAGSTAWIHATEDTRRRFVAVLRVPPVVGAVTAVRASIASDG